MIDHCSRKFASKKRILNSLIITCLRFLKSSVSSAPSARFLKVSMAIRGGSSDKATPANEGAVGKGEGEPVVKTFAQDPLGITPDRREVSSVPTVGGREASGVVREVEDKIPEEEDEEEIVDPKEKLEEEYRESAQCAPAKRHYDDCVKCVTAAAESGDHSGSKEDCVEEFFHLTRCATASAAAKLWTALK
ncbi:hypothetical protein V493_02559 [Pseudogymnoascus sp. VKM F-4281 (FW-2241)]|nr:hypothetical protein V493_02559 [Pseudogymnoascus sp. VKM F-4281 (FW-2241)]